MGVEFSRPGMAVLGSTPAAVGVDPTPMKGRSTHDSQAVSLDRMAALALSGRLDPVAPVAALERTFPHVALRPRDRTALEWLAARRLPRAEPEAWVETLRLRPAASSPEVEAAIRRVLARGLARASELRDGKGAFVEGEPVGAYLLQAGLFAEAAATLFETVAKTPHSGRAALHLGNALWQLDRRDEARDGYRRAFRVAPFEMRLAEVEDPEVRDLARLADGLRLAGDPRAWIPVIGYLEGVLPFSALDPVPGKGYGDATRVYDLLIAHSGARSDGEREAIRRDLQLLAPVLYAALVQARKLDTLPPPYAGA